MSRISWFLFLKQNLLKHVINNHKYFVFEAMVVSQVWIHTDDYTLINQQNTNELYIAFDHHLCLYFVLLNGFSIAPEINCETPVISYISFAYEVLNLTV